MSVTPDKIRNVMIAGHSDSGKTSLAEALLFHAKAIERQGKVEEGNTTMDFDSEEAKRRVSLSAAVAPFETEGVKVNLIDVPGLFDFELGLYEGIMAAESVLIAVSGRSGLTVGAQKAYRLAEKMGKSRMFFVGKLDTENADYYKVFDELKTEFGAAVCPIVIPHMLGGQIAYVNLISEKCFVYENGVAKQVDMPDVGPRYEEVRAAMFEAVAETDDALMEKFFDGTPFTIDELTEGLRIGVKTGSIAPILCGVPTKLEAMDMLTFNMRVLLPSAQRGGAMKGEAGGTETEVECDPAGPLAAYVFKTVADPFVGKLSFVKVVRGVLKADSPVVNSRTGENEKMGKLLFLKGKKQMDASEISAGDIGAVTKLSATKTGDTLCAAGHVVALNRPDFPHPTFSMALHTTQKGDESKISTAMQRLLEEDGTVTYRMDSETMQQVISGLGEQHLDVLVAKLKSKFGIDVELSQPRVGYRETLR